VSSVLTYTESIYNNILNGAQKTQVVDGSYANIDFATSAKQLADNHQVTVSNQPTEFPLPASQVASISPPAEFPLPASQVLTLTPPAQITGFATEAKQDTLLTELEKKADLTETQPVDVQPIATIYNGTKTVPTGTAEAISASQAIRSVTIKALSTNTVALYVGATGCTTSNGLELLAGESVSLDISNLASVFVISGSASQVIRYVAI